MYVKKYPSSIRCRISNPRPLEHVSSGNPQTRAPVQLWKLFDGILMRCSKNIYIEIKCYLMSWHEEVVKVVYIYIGLYPCEVTNISFYLYLSFDLPHLSHQRCDEIGLILKNLVYKIFRKVTRSNIRWFLGYSETRLLRLHYLGQLL